VLSHVYMSRVPHIEWVMSHELIESCHTCGRFMSQVWMSHVTHMRKSRHACGWVISPFLTPPKLNESCHTYWMSHVMHIEWVMLHILHEPCQHIEWVMSHVLNESFHPCWHPRWMSQLNESCHTYWMNHVTHMNEWCHTFWMSHVTPIKSVVSHVWMGYVTHIGDTCYFYKTSHVTRMNEPCHTHEGVMLHLYKKSCHKYEWVFSPI